MGVRSGTSFLLLFNPSRYIVPNLVKFCLFLLDSSLEKDSSMSQVHSLASDILVCCFSSVVSKHQTRGFELHPELRPKILDAIFTRLITAAESGIRFSDLFSRVVQRCLQDLGELNRKVFSFPLSLSFLILSVV